MIPERYAVSVLVYLLLVNTLALLPLLTTGYVDDDMLNSQIRGIMIQEHRSLWGVTSFYIMQWVRNQGRLIPLAFYVYSVFYLLKNVLFYKLFVLSTILAGIAAFFTFLKRLSGSQVLASIAVLLLPFIFQFRVSWDPILAFCAQYPLIALLLFSSLSLFLLALDEGKRWALWLSIFLFVCTALIFEVVYPMFLVYTLAAYLRLKNIRSAVRESWPFFAITSCLILASSILRAHASDIGAPYKMHLDRLIILKTYCVQLVGAVPFSYFLFDPRAAFTSAIQRWPVNLVELLPLMVLLAAFALLAVHRKLSSESQPINTAINKGIFVLGVLLLTIPASLISLSPKYQAETWGDAYLPVYLTCFGVAVVLAIGLERLYRFVQGRRIAAILSFGWLLLFGFNFRNNWLISQTLNASVWNPRVLLEDALQRGLLSGISPKSVILIDGAEPWDNAWEYSAKTGVRWNVAFLNRSLDPGTAGACPPISDPQVCRFSVDSPVYTIQIRHLTGGTGAVLLARVEKTYCSVGCGLLSREVTAYFHLPQSAQPLEMVVSGQNIERVAGARMFRAYDRDQHVLRQGRDWKLVSLQRNIYFDALSLKGEISAKETPSAIIVQESRNSFELRSHGAELLHVRYDSGDPGAEHSHPVTLPDSASLPTTYTVELLFLPAGMQSPYATIISNHPGKKGFRGLTIEQIGDVSNNYALFFGDGNMWVPVASFAASPGIRHYLAVAKDKRKVRAYLDGQLLAEKVLAADPVASDYPLILGNWVNQDRPFNGFIQEIRITPTTQSGNSITDQEETLQKASAQ